MKFVICFTIWTCVLLFLMFAIPVGVPISPNVVMALMLLVTWGTIIPFGVYVTLQQEPPQSKEDAQAMADSDYFHWLAGG